MHEVVHYKRTLVPFVICPIYNRNIIPIIEDLVDKDILPIKGLIEKIDAKFVLIDNKKIEKKEFRNLNRPSDI